MASPHVLASAIQEEESPALSHHQEDPVTPPVNVADSGGEATVSAEAPPAVRHQEESPQEESPPLLHQGNEVTLSAANVADISGEATSSKEAPALDHDQEDLLSFDNESVTTDGCDGSKKSSLVSLPGEEQAEDLETQQNSTHQLNANATTRQRRYQKQATDFDGHYQQPKPPWIRFLLWIYH